MLKSGRHPRILEPVHTGQPHNPFYRFILSQRFLALIGLIFLLAVIFPLLKTHNQKRLVEQEIADLQTQINQFENQSQQLSELLDYLKSEQSLEDQARLSLNMKKPGEAVVVIENKNIVPAVKIASNSDLTEGNFWKWWRYFFD